MFVYINLQYIWVETWLLRKTMNCLLFFFSTAHNLVCLFAALGKSSLCGRDFILLLGFKSISGVVRSLFFQQSSPIVHMCVHPFMYPILFFSAFHTYMTHSYKHTNTPTHTCAPSCKPTDRCDMSHPNNLSADRLSISLYLLSAYLWFPVAYTVYLFLLLEINLYIIHPRVSLAEHISIALLLRAFYLFLPLSSPSFALSCHYCIHLSNLPSSLLIIYPSDAPLPLFFTLPASFFKLVLLCGMLYIFILGAALKLWEPLCPQPFLSPTWKADIFICRSEWDTERDSVSCCKFKCKMLYMSAHSKESLLLHHLQASWQWLFSFFFFTFGMNRVVFLTLLCT